MDVLFDPFDFRRHNKGHGTSKPAKPQRLAGSSQPDTPTTVAGPAPGRSAEEGLLSLKQELPTPPARIRPGRSCWIEDVLEPSFAVILAVLVGTYRAEMNSGCGVFCAVPVPKCWWDFT